MSRVAPIQISWNTEITPKNFVRNIKHMDKVVDKALEKFFKDLYQVGVTAAVAKAPVDTGNLRHSLHAKTAHTASYYNKDGMAIGSRLPYAPYQDNALKWGVKASSWPNVTTLKAWVARKIKPPANELNTVTFFVGRHIKEFGVAPHNFMESADIAVRTHLKAAEREFNFDILRAVNT